MDEAEKIYHETVNERMRNKYGASHRVVGSKSKKCTLPSDGMSRKELESMNGPVVTYNLAQPMGWAEFKSMSLDLQTEYIRKRAELGWGREQLAEMFGIKPVTYSSYMKKHHPGERLLMSGKKAKGAEPIAKPEHGKPTEEARQESLLKLTSFSVEFTGDCRAIFERVLLMVDGSTTYRVKIEVEEAK